MPILLCLLLLTVLLFLIFVLPRVAEESVRFDRVGTVTVYSGAFHPSQVILFVSGEQGWDQEAANVAHALTAFDAVVVGIDLPHYLTKLAHAEETCSYPGGDFDALSKFVQQRFGFPMYVHPVLVGVGAGAALAYATLAQAPPDMFRGVISLGFCPELVAHKPLCEWNSLRWQSQPSGSRFTLVPGAALSAAWVAVHGDQDSACTASTVEAFTKEVPHGTFLLVPHVSRDFSSPRAWMPQFRQAFARLLETAPLPQSGPLADLPLVEVPATGPTAQQTLAVILSGDGGWASIDRQLAGTLAGQGVPVVGVNSLRYFWTRRTAEDAARDLERILRHYLTTWQKTDALLIGYSRGADVLPFMANRLPPEVLDRVRGIAMLGPALTAEFEFHLTDWLGESEAAGRPVLPELEKLRGKRIVCVYGEEEKNTLCTKVPPPLADVIRLTGGHHFDGSYEVLARTVLREAGAPVDASNK
jgi:type IV secretory pathway VirJ component